MKRSKRIFALLGAILLVLLYLSTLIFALMDSEFAADMLKVSVAGTIVIPVLLYGYLLFYRLSGKDDYDDTDDMN